MKGENMEIDINEFEPMIKEVYMVCKKLIAITDFECCFYGTTEEVEWAQAYVKAYEEYTS